MTIFETTSNVQIYYLLLVLQGDLYEVEEKRNKLRLRGTDHVQYRKQVWDARRRETYQIDIVTEKSLPRFLDLIDKETQTIKRRFKAKQALVRDSINRLVEKARKTKRKKVSFREIWHT